MSRVEKRIKELSKREERLEQEYKRKPADPGTESG